jgi:hypothetical protein
MASNPTIKAALEAAAWAECEARAAVNECEDKRCPRRTPCRWCMAGAVAAIAAFLRALPSASEHGACVIPASAGGGAWWVRRLAAAVEEAARDE